MGSTVDLRRITRSIPRHIRANHTGVTFVNILFGLTVTAIVAEAALEIRTAFRPGVGWHEVRLTHLGVAFTLAVTSWIGYHTSQNVPQFRIRFINVPLFQFALDVSMVITYYLLFAFAEPARAIGRLDMPLVDSLLGTGVVATPVGPDVRPEATLVAVAFLLYFAWDVMGWIVDRDPLYAAVRGRAHGAGSWSTRSEFTSRRWVTVYMGLVATLLAVLAWSLEPATAFAVGMFDLGLVAALVIYRLAKEVFDPRASTRA